MTKGYFVLSVDPPGVVEGKKAPELIGLNGSFCPSGCGYAECVKTERTDKKI